jgi:hypothetical protein
LQRRKDPQRLAYLRLDKLTRWQSKVLLHHVDFLESKGKGLQIVHTPHTEVPLGKRADIGQLLKLDCFVFLLPVLDFFEQLEMVHDTVFVAEVLVNAFATRLSLVFLHRRCWVYNCENRVLVIRLHECC